MLKVRLSNQNDTKDLFQWRNEITSRQMLFNSSLIEWNEHLSWHKNLLKNKNIHLLIGLNENEEKVGVVYFNIQKNNTKVSINLSSQSRGRGLSKIFLMEGIKNFKKVFPYQKTILAEIKTKNIKSIKLFKSAGFILVKETNNVVVYSINL